MVSEMYGGGLHRGEYAKYKCIMIVMWKKGVNKNVKLD